MRTMITLVASAFAGLIVGGLVSLIGVGATLSTNLLISLCSGLCIAAAAEVADSRTDGWPLRLRLVAFALAVGIGSLPAVVVGMVVLQPPDAAQAMEVVIKIISISLVFGAVLTTLFILLRRRSDMARDLADLDLRRAQAERASLEAHLRMLQAQIEPHFLFNTLATLSGLIDSDPALARQLLDRLVFYLRATLSLARTEAGTLGDEVNLAQTYLDICRVRLGPRLSYQVEVPAALAGLPCPAMLVQPLVENAIKHAAEARPGPLTVRITAERGDGRVRVSVIDDGPGFAPTAGDGFGLENVRARLAAAYGAAATFCLEESLNGGVRAVIEIPATEIRP